MATELNLLERSPRTVEAVIETFRQLGQFSLQHLGRIGEVIPSYTILTMNADAHPLRRRMHKSDPKAAPHEQDKRSVIAIDPRDWDTWLTGPSEGAHALIRLTAIEKFDAGPADAP